MRESLQWSQRSCSHWPTTSCQLEMVEPVWLPSHLSKVPNSSFVTEIFSPQQADCARGWISDEDYVWRGCYLPNLGPSTVSMTMERRPDYDIISRPLDGEGCGNLPPECTLRDTEFHYPGRSEYAAMVGWSPTVGVVEWFSIYHPNGRIRARVPPATGNS